MPEISRESEPVITCNNCGKCTADTKIQEDTFTKTRELIEHSVQVAVKQLRINRHITPFKNEKCIKCGKYTRDRSIIKTHMAQVHEVQPRPWGKSITRVVK